MKRKLQRPKIENRQHTQEMAEPNTTSQVMIGDANVKRDRHAASGDDAGDFTEPVMLRVRHTGLMSGPEEDQGSEIVNPSHIKQEALAGYFNQDSDEMEACTEQIEQDQLAMAVNRQQTKQEQSSINDVQRPETKTLFALNYLGSLHLADNGQNLGSDSCVKQELSSERSGYSDASQEQHTGIVPC